MENGEQWVFELFEQDTSLLLSSIVFEAQDYCLYTSVDGGPWQGIGCVGDPSQFYVIGTFYSRCLDTKQHFIRTTHGNSLDDSFVPTQFTPGAPTINPLGDVTPEVPDSYHSSGNIPGHAAGTVELTVEIKDNEGCDKPLPDVPVDLKNTIVSQSGSHLHFSGADLPGTGTYIAATPTWSSISFDKTRIAAQTDENGLLKASYLAGEFGVEEQLEATAHNRLNGTTISSSETYAIRVPGLVPLDTSGIHSLRGSYSTSCDIGHNDSQTARRSHYVTPFTKAKIAQLNTNYQAETGNSLCLNDASLVYGGFFDRGAGGRDEKCHSSHRLGVDIDVNTQPNSPCTENLATETVSVQGIQ